MRHWVLGGRSTSGPSLRDLRLEDSYANHGGGLGLENARAVFRTQQVVIDGNDALFGGGLSIRGSATWNPDLSRDFKVFGLDLTNNTAGHGGGMWCEEVVDIRSCDFRWNVATKGGGLFVNLIPVSVENSVIVDNAAQIGGGVYVDFILASTELAHCTISRNVSWVGGGGGHLDEANLLLSNSIVWDNSSQNIGMNTIGHPSNVFVEYSDVQGGAGTGTGEFDADPLFVDPNSGDYSLQAGSPCIDRADGDRSRLFDRLGEERVDDPAVPNQGVGDPPYADLGAYERQLSFQFGF